VPAAKTAREQGDFGALLAERLARASRERVPRTGSGFDLKAGWRLTHRDLARDAVLAALPRTARPDKAVTDRLFALAPGLGRTYDRLADQRSRALLLDLLAFRALGARQVRLPVTVDGFWREVARVDAELRTGPAPGPVPEFGTYRIPGREGPITLLGLPTQVVEFFVLEQYAFRHGGLTIEAEEGDVVVDGGGGMGDTALYFADRVGPHGRVICCEFEPANLAQLQLNLDANPHLAGRIDVVRQPLWDAPGEELRFDPAFGRTMVTAAEGDRSVATTTIDEQLAGGRVDLIKLDVEGAEKRALEGARETIERDHPNLAVSAYHHLEDLVELPDLLAEMGYRMFLDHFLPAPEETVLFGGRPRLNSEPT
jgi:FkbM family methyltransferase